MVHQVPVVHVCMHHVSSSVYVKSTCLQNVPGSNYSAMSSSSAIVAV